MQKAGRRIVEKLRAHGHEAFFAGGWVRDFLMRRKAKDVDIATGARPEEVIRLFPKSLAIGASFGVVRVFMYGHAYEVATFRSDNQYLDGRHPSSVTFSGPEQDAHRRDFTINGLFYDPLSDRLIDYVHGKADIQNKLIRTIGNPKDRFTEDRLRMLRAIRFACTFGFQIASETWEAIKTLSPEIVGISGERIRDEILKILTGPEPSRGLDLLHESGILSHILPEIEAMAGTDLFRRTKAALENLHRPSAVLALSALLLYAWHGQAENTGKAVEEICRRLKMSNEETGRAVDLTASCRRFSSAREMREPDLRRFLNKPHISDYLELYRVHCVSSGRDLEDYEFCLDKLEAYEMKPVPPPLIKGEDLIEIGYRPGPVFKQILRTVEDLQLEGILSKREEALEHVKRTFPLTNKMHS